MQMAFEESDKPETLVITHGEGSLKFDVSNYNRASLTGENDVTIFINLYWKSLSISHQEQIYVIYEKISVIFGMYLSTIGLRQQLMPLVKRLWELHNLENIERWIFRNTNIHIPAKFEDAYVHSEEVPFSREKTYTKPDYAKLVALSLSYRIMMPIWGEFIRQTESEIGSKRKEFHAFKLLETSHVYDCAAMHKLRVYIDSNIQINEINALSVVVRGVGLEEYPIHILASLVVKRLTIGDIRGTELNTNLVVTIHNDISARNNGNNGGNLGDPLQKKSFEADNNDDNGVSRQENFKIKEERSTGVVKARKVYVDMYLHLIAQRLMPDVDLEELDRYVKQAENIASHPIRKGQIRLIQNVVASIVEPECFEYLPKTTVIRLAGLAQMYLWKKGHHKLAVLTTAVPVDNTSQGGGGSTARISREQMELLEKYFPFNRISAKRKNTIPKNRAVEAIDEITNHFTAGDWILTCMDDQAESVIGAKNIRRYSCPHDIKILLAKLAIEQVERERELYLAKRTSSTSTK